MIVRPGDPSDKVFIVSEGEVDIFLKSFDREFVLQRIGVGSSIGAMAMMTDTSADFDFYAWAATGVTVQVLSKFDLDMMARDNDEIEKMIKWVDLEILWYGLPYCKFQTCYNLETTYVDPWVWFHDAVNRVVMMNRYNRAKMFVNVVHEVRKKHQQKNMSFEDEVTRDEIFINESVNIELEWKMDAFAK